MRQSRQHWQKPKQRERQLPKLDILNFFYLKLCKGQGYLAFFYVNIFYLSDD
jgi:hypothetical protein